MKANKLTDESSISIQSDFGFTNTHILFEPIENKKYYLKIIKTEKNILIEANQIEDSNIFYKIKLNLNDFYQLSKGFKMFDNLEEIYDVLQNIFISKKVSIVKKDCCFFIIFIIKLLDGKEQEINIKLNENIKDINTIKINKLENEIKEIKDINELLRRIKFLQEISKSQDILFKKIKDLDHKVKNNNMLLKKVKYLEDKINAQNILLKKVKYLEDKIKFQDNQIKKISNVEKGLKEVKKEIGIIKKWKNII